MNRIDYQRRLVRSLYAKEKLPELIRLLEDSLHDLSMWSVYNDDVISGQINEIRDIIMTIKVGDKK